MPSVPRERALIHPVDRRRGNQFALNTKVGQPRTDRYLGMSAFYTGSFVAGTGVGYTLATHLNSPPPRVQWQFESTARVVLPPTVVDGAVSIGTWDDTLYSLAAGVGGSSVGSRVRLGTLGHHDKRGI